MIKLPVKIEVNNLHEMSPLITEILLLYVNMKYNGIVEFEIIINKINSIRFSVAIEDKEVV